MSSLEVLESNLSLFEVKSPVAEEKISTEKLKWTALILVQHYILTQIPLCMV